MKTSPKWLQSFFDDKLPSAEELGDALTFHSCEIEEITPNYIDVNVLPDRAAYCLCHRGIAYELSAILGMPMNDPLRLPTPQFETTDKLELKIEDTTKCLRHMGALVRGVKVGPSPDWLQEALGSVGQRSINNVVDATNYVMLDMGQPLHAFDAGKLKWGGEKLVVGVRGAHAGEEVTVLTGETYKMPEGALVLCEGADGSALDVAGIKGGMASGITEDTRDLFVSVANFDGTLIRKTAQALKLFTDASQRFQNKPSPELPAYGMQAVLKLITDLAGGEVVGVVDMYPDSSKARAVNAPVILTLEKINTVLGTQLTPAHVTTMLERLGFAYLHENSNGVDLFTVTAPFERRDIVIPEDVIEEIGRIIGYDTVAPAALPPIATAPDQARYRGIEALKDFLTDRGFTELSTQTFAKEGDIILANPLDQTKPALRTTLAENMHDSLTRGALVAPRVLGPAKELKLFEIGTVFTNESERTSLVLGYTQLLGKKSSTLLTEVLEQLNEEFFKDAEPSIVRADAKDSHDVLEVDLTTIPLEAIGTAYAEIRQIALGTFKPFSIYPFALRDVAVWTPERTEQTEVSAIIEREAEASSGGESLLARIDLFDRFEKSDAAGTRISYAFRLVFESMDRTLSDEDLNPLMEKVTAALNAQEGFEVR